MVKTTVIQCVYFTVFFKKKCKICLEIKKTGKRQIDSLVKLCYIYFDLDREKDFWWSAI